MHAHPVRFARMLALAVIGASTLSDPSFAEKQSPYVVKQLCATAGGTFTMEPSGKYNCVYPSNNAIWTVKQCNARQDCEYVDFCGKTICGRTPVAGTDKGGRPKGSKPSKLEGPPTVTAGTVKDRGGDAAQGRPAPNTTLNSGIRIGPATGSGTPQNAVPAEPKIAKPAPVPAQLSERLGRLQQSR